MWADQQTSTHQDHVVAHIIGATVLGYFILDEAAHLLLDIGFVWTILLDCGMGLVPRSMAIAELEIDDQSRAELLDQARRLEAEGPSAAGFSSLTQAPPGCLITGVSLYALDERRRLIIECEDASLLVETSLAEHEIRIEALAG